MKTRTVSLLVFLVLLGLSATLTGCRIGGRFDESSSPEPAMPTFAVTGKVTLPAGVVNATSIRMSVSAAIAPTEFTIILVDRDNRIIADTSSFDPASGTFRFDAVPAGADYRVQVRVKGHCILQSHIDTLAADQRDIPVDTDTTAIALLVERSGFTLETRQVETAVVNGTLNIEAMTGAIDRWLRNSATDIDGDVMSMVLSSIDESTLVELVKAVPTASTTVSAPIPGGQTGALPAPAGLAGISGDGSIRLSWQPVPGAVGYNLYWAAAAGVQTHLATRIRGVSSPYAFKPAALGVPFFFVVTAVSSLGESAASGEITVTGQAASAIAAAPGGVKATPASGSVTVTWDPVPGASEYRLYWGIQAGVGKTTGTCVPNVNSPFVHAGLANGTAISYVVTAVNSLGESPESSAISATPCGLPGKPVGLTVTPGQNSNQIAWPPVGGATRYALFWSEGQTVTSGSGMRIDGVTSPYKHSGLVAGRTYRYVLVAYNAIGASADSDLVVGQTTALEQPTDLSASDLIGTWNIAQESKENTGASTDDRTLVPLLPTADGKYGTVVVTSEMIAIKGYETVATGDGRKQATTPLSPEAYSWSLSGNLLSYTSSGTTNTAFVIKNADGTIAWILSNGYRQLWQKTTPAAGGGTTSGGTTSGSDTTGGDTTSGSDTAGGDTTSGGTTSGSDTTGDDVAMIPVVADGAIEIDGSVSDWASIAPKIRDASGDYTNSALDITAAYLARDSKNLYFRIERRGSTYPGPATEYDSKVGSSLWLGFYCDRTDRGLEPYQLLIGLYRMQGYNEPVGQTEPYFMRKMPDNSENMLARGFPLAENGTNIEGSVPISLIEEVEFQGFHCETKLLNTTADGTSPATVKFASYCFSTAEILGEWEIIQMSRSETDKTMVPITAGPNGERYR